MTSCFDGIDRDLNKQRVIELINIIFPGSFIPERWVGKFNNLGLFAHSIH